MEKKKSQRHSHRDNKATDKNISSRKFQKKNEDIPTSQISSDVLGSYTGVPEDAFDLPVQDADDL
ncbi:MAG: hypothetical protein IKJ27_05075 [Clostridia bacterium]|nr:hypothetical protein [Clostridia bacterium]